MSKIFVVYFLKSWYFVIIIFLVLSFETCKVRADQKIEEFGVQQFLVIVSAVFPLCNGWGKLSGLNGFDP